MEFAYGRPELKRFKYSNQIYDCMVKVLYCDRCGNQITSGNEFDVEFRSFGGHYPQLCDECEKKLKKIIEEFIKEGKKEKKTEVKEEKQSKKKFGLF